jgi:hypothetical protein
MAIHKSFKVINSAGPSLVNIDKNGDKLLNVADRPFSVDIDPIGTSFFDVSIRTMANPVKEHTTDDGKHSVVVAALGDALASSHFFTGGGMSVGMCIVFCVYYEIIVISWKLQY